MFNGGLFHVDIYNQHHTKATPQYVQFPLNIINTQLPYGQVISDELTIEEYQQVIDNLKTDKGVRIECLYNSNLHSCHCHYCQCFNTFQPMIHLPMSKIGQMIDNKLGETVRQPIYKIQRCNKLWHHYTRFMTPKDSL